MPLFNRGKKRAKSVVQPAAKLSDEHFYERWQELVDQSELVETPEEVAGLAKSLTALVGERVGISKAVPSPGDLDDDPEGEEGEGDPEGDPDGGADPELEGEPDPEEEGDPEGAAPGEDDELDEEGNPKSKTKAVGPAAAVEAPGAPGISKSVASDELQGVDAGPIFEALCEEIAGVNAGNESITKSLAGVLKELSATRQELGKVRSELEDLRTWRDEADEKQDGISKSLDAMLSRGKGTPQGRAAIGGAALRDKEVPSLERGGEEIEEVEGDSFESTYNIARGEIIKGLHAHLMTGNNEKFKTGVSNDVISRFDSIKPNEMTRLAEIAKKQNAGEFDGTPEASTEA